MGRRLPPWVDAASDRAYVIVDGSVRERSVVACNVDMRTRLVAGSAVPAATCFSRSLSLGGCRLALIECVTHGFCEGAWSIGLLEKAEARQNRKHAGRGIAAVAARANYLEGRFFEQEFFSQLYACHVTRHDHVG